VTKEYHGDDITVTYDGKRCRHFAECLRALPAVFDTHERPWIRPANAPAEAVAEAVMRCPSGALHFVSGSLVEQPAARTTVEVRADGPVMLRGDFTVQTPDGPIHETRAAICGCRKTSNAPFCDGACGCSP
jgi:uncharacterized Fe-S cluster protein YjdI